MAIGITLFYILAELLGPATIFGSLAEYRIELFVALLAVFVSIPSIPESGIFSSRMTLALAGLSFAVVAATASAGWLGAIPLIGYGLLPVLLGFVLVALNCKTRRHLQLVILVLFVGCVFDIGNGVAALQHDGASPYIYYQGFAGNVLPRIRGLEFLNDPNDFAQLLVSLLPLMFFFARKESAFRNRFLIPSAIAVLLWGMYLTKSRGGTVALVATIVLAARRKIGLIPAAICGSLLFLGALALGWSGGREVSSESGADRIELWATGLSLVKTHFFFGVGVGNFWNYAPNTAHNSVVICAAELGVVGLLFWVMFILSAIRGGVLLGRGEAAAAEPETSMYGHEALIAGGSFATMSVAPAAPLRRASSLPEPVWFDDKPLEDAQHDSMRRVDILPVGNVAAIASRFSPDVIEEKSGKPSDEEIRRMARLLLYSLTGFLAAGWFLSRALSIWLFIYCGMMHAVLRLAAENNIAPPRDDVSFLLRWSAVIAVVLLAIVSIIIRVSH